MGMFNTIIVECPNCGKEIEFQTKSGTKMLERYYIDKVPEEEIQGILGQTERCYECNQIIEIEPVHREYKDYSYLVN